MQCSGGAVCLETVSCIVLNVALRNVSHCLACNSAVIGTSHVMRMIQCHRQFAMEWHKRQTANVGRGI